VGDKKKEIIIKVYWFSPAAGDRVYGRSSEIFKRLKGERVAKILAGLNKT
jgi:hypothetical protein